jgi:hypothetical protein
MTDVLCDASVAVGWFLDRHPPSYALVEASMSGRCRLVVLV